MDKPKSDCCGAEIFKISERMAKWGGVKRFSFCSKCYKLYQIKEGKNE